MTAKHQITIPKKITEVFGLKKGSIFDIEVSKGGIELIPLETIRKVFTEEEYKKLDTLSRKEGGKETRLTKRFIDNLRKGEI
jgi:AbrB family looped-hinge helix DNA binding protein